MRKMQLTARIVADAERKLTKTGSEYLSFRVASNEFNDEKDESGKPKTYWLNVTSYNQHHFNLAKYLTKGKPVMIDGDYSDRIYQNKSGECEIGRDIRATGIYFLPGSEDNGGTSQGTRKADAEESPSVQTKMVDKASVKKPTTNEVKVPVQNPVADDDDLPF